MKNYKFQNKQGEDGKNEPTQISMHSIQENIHESVEETTIPETVQETGHKSINEIMQKTIVVDDVVDVLDQTIRDRELDFLDERNLKKFEQIRKGAKTPLSRLQRVQT